MPEPRTHVAAVLAAAETSTRLYARGRFVADDFVAVADGAELTDRIGGILVSLSRWRSERTRLLSERRSIGVLITPPEMPTTADDLWSAALVAVRLAKVTDGRAYSIARRLRDSLGYAGPLRATGDVLLDQLNLLARCGFDEFEIVNPPTIRALEAGHVVGIAHVYQPPEGARRLRLARDEMMRRLR
jgi:phosphoadenosine phosphosulfate reductase